jgi:ABC-type glycerol-3-phosphate transport system substrate-binding protein
MVEEGRLMTRIVPTLLAILTLVLAACAAAGPTPPAATGEADIEIAGPVSVTVWHALTSDPQKGALEAAVTKFNETNGKGITVTPVVQGTYPQLYQKTLGAITAGTLPEIVHAYESQVADYTKADVVIDLDPYVNSKKNGIDKASQEDIYKPYFDTNRFPQYGNKLLSFPFTKSLAVMYTNEDVLKAAGVTPAKTWADWEQAVMKATKKDASGKTTQYGYVGTTDASYFNAMVLARGGKIMAADNKTVAWDGKEGLETLQMLDRLYRGGYAYTPTGFAWQNDFAQSKVAYAFSSTSSRPFLAGAMKTPVNWSAGLPPQADAASGKTVMFGANIAVLKTTPQKQLASWLFIKWMAEQGQTADWAMKSFYMPVRKSAANDAALKAYWTSKDPQGKQAFDVIGSSVPEPNVRGQQEIRDVVNEMYVKVTTGKATPEAAIKDAGTKANQILKDNQ